MEAKLKKKEELQIVEYLKVLSDSIESDEQMEEMPEELLGAHEEKENNERWRPRTIVRNFGVLQTG